MGRRTNFADVAATALLFIYDAAGMTMISLEKVCHFDEIINQNLDAMNSKISAPFFREYDSELFFRATDEEGKVYLVMNPDADIERARELHIYALPIDFMLAAEKENALATIGLKFVDGKVCKVADVTRYTGTSDSVELAKYASNMHYDSKRKEEVLKKLKRFE